MREHNFAGNHIYHIFNRGVEKRLIFIDDHDYKRFIDDIDAFNDPNPAPNSDFRFAKSRQIDGPEREKPIVDLLAFCLMPNHYHFLVRQKVEGGITKFMRKLGDGYVKYFNARYKRVGTLFQGKFKSVRIEDDKHFAYIPHYIHLNPLDLVIPAWRLKGLTKENTKTAARFLESYKWSSHPDYLGKKNFPSLTNRNLFNEYLGGVSGYTKSFYETIKDLDFSIINKFTLKMLIGFIPLLELADTLSDIVFQ